MSSDILEIPVDFGNVSIGDVTASVGYRAEREQLGLEIADQFFAGRQLRGEVRVIPKDSASGQRQLNGTAAVLENVVIESKRFGCDAKHISGRLTFNLAAIDVESLSRFSKRGGRIRVECVGSLPDEDSDHSANGNGASHAESQDNNPPLSDPRLGLSPGAVENLSAAKVNHFKVKTVALLEDFMELHGATWHEKVKGIGAVAAGKIADKIAAFRSKFPRYMSDDVGDDETASDEDDSDE